MNIHEHPFKSAELCMYERRNAPMVSYNVTGALLLLHNYDML